MCTLRRRHKWKNLKVLPLYSTIKFSVQMKSGVCSAPAVGIRLPRYTPGKYTRGGWRAPQLSVLMKSSKVSGNAVCPKYLTFVCLTVKFLCFPNPNLYYQKMCIFFRDTINVIPTLPYDMYIDTKKYFCRYMCTLKYLLGDDLWNNINES